MDLTLSPTEEAFRDEVRGWLAGDPPGEIPEDDKEAFEFSRRWQRKLHDARWAGVSWPEEYAGRGATRIEQAIFTAEMVRAKAPRVANILGLVMGGPVVITHGTEAQKQRYLEPILSGEEIWRQGLPRRGAGESPRRGGDPLCGGDLGPGLLGARRRVGPRVAEDTRREAQRWLGSER